MSKTRKAVVGAWGSALSIATAGSVTATAGGGLLDPSVCISAGTLLILVLTPTAALSEAATKVVKSRT